MALCPCLNNFNARPIFDAVPPLGDRVEVRVAIVEPTPGASLLKREPAEKGSPLNHSPPSRSPDPLY